MNTEKERKAIEMLKSFEPLSEPYYLCYSGGKDSDCIRILAELAGVKCDITHNHTTVDAPETVRYVRSVPGVQISYPEKTMWTLIVEKRMPPTRLARYCCEALKERGGQGRIKITGVRREESPARAESAGFVKIIGKPKTLQKLADEQEIEYRVTKKGGMVLNDDNGYARGFVESCYRTTSTMINPIVDWAESEVWEFLHYYNCESNPLYQCGDKRIGCVGCPMAGIKGMKADFKRYPKYRAMYVAAFDRMVKKRLADGLTTDAAWIDGEHVMRWWVGDDPLQITLFDYISADEANSLLDDE